MTSLQNRMDFYRREWMVRMIERDNRMVDVNIMRILSRNSQFFASTTMLVLGALIERFLMRRFEQGDPDYPIWTGGFWGSAAEVPALALAPISLVQSTIAGCLVFLTVVADRVFGHQVTRREWIGVALTAIGLAFLAGALEKPLLVEGPSGEAVLEIAGKQYLQSSDPMVPSIVSIDAQSRLTSCAIASARCSSSWPLGRPSSAIGLPSSGTPFTATESPTETSRAMRGASISRSRVPRRARARTTAP